MARKSQERAIGEGVWTVTQFPATEGLAILTRLLKLVGPAMGAISRGEGGNVEVGTFIALLIERLDEAETIALVKRLLKDTRKDGREILPQFDLEFMGNYHTLLNVLGFVLEVNYGDFFAEMNRPAPASQGAPAALS